jgi:zinc protease
MKKTQLLLMLLVALKASGGINYPIHSKILSNGLKIIVCEKSTNAMAEIQVWYRVGSKDEWDGVRGMAHLFEHMMFRGSKKFTGDNKPFKLVDKLGGSMNAYTTYDRTVYHEEVPAKHIESAIEMEADRMENLILDQHILDTEREVVGEELRLSMNNWYNRLAAERYKFMYPAKHPYQIDVIGKLEEITAFSTTQCRDFYNKFYSPNNAYVIVTGNVKAEDIFAWCEKHFGPIAKQLPLNSKKSEPDIFAHKIALEEMTVDYPLQIYSYVIPSPAFGHKDYYPFNLLSELLFSNSNSYLHKRLVNTNLAYQISGTQDISRLYNNFTYFEVFMKAGPGNAKVKKEINKEIYNIIKEGIEEEDLKKYLSNLETRLAFIQYSNSEISDMLGHAEYYYADHSKYNATFEAYRKIKPDDLRQIAETYFHPEKMKVLNIKPAETE